MKSIAQFSLAMAGAGLLGLMNVPQAHSLSLSYDRSYGEPGFAPGQLFVPQGIGVQDTTGDVYVSNGRGINPDGSFNPNLGNRVDVFDAQGNYLRSVGSGRQGSGEGLDEPADLKFDPITGNLHVGDVFNSEIDVYDPNTGEYIRSYGSFGGPVAGRIFFGPGGMSFGNDGNVYITDFSLDVVKVYDAYSGELVKTIGSSGTELGQFLGPAGITVSSNTGRIYVSDQYNYRIQVLSSDGQPLFTFGEKGSALGQLREPIGVEVDEYENIYVADSQNSRVQVFDKDGNFLTSFGTPAAATPPALGSPPFGDPLDLTPGTFNWTAGLHYDDSKLYVGDFFQGRIQVLNITDAQPPEPSSTIPEPSALFGILAYGLSAVFVKGIKKQK